MKIIYTSDLHGIEHLYSELFRLAEAADIVIIGGDILPKHGDFRDLIRAQKDFIIQFLAPELKRLHEKRSGIQVYAMMGNDDWAVNMPYLEEIEDAGLLRLVHNRRYPLGDGFEIIGYSCVPPTPFSVKDFERLDTTDAPIEPQRFTACISTGDGIQEIDAYEHFKTHPTMEDELENLPKPRSFQKSVYVMHAPPRDTKLDVLYDRRPVGSYAVRRFIEKYQPLLTLHGHIHESPQVSGEFIERIGETICINSGQSTSTLHAVIFDLDNIEGTIEHTVFGRVDGF